MLKLLGEIEGKLKSSSGDEAAKYVEQCLLVGRASHSIAVKVQALHHLIFTENSGSASDLSRKSRFTKTGSQTGIVIKIYM